MRKMIFFTSLLFFTLVDLAMECFLPLIVLALIVGDSTVHFARSSYQVSSFNLLVFLYLCFLAFRWSSRSFRDPKFLFCGQRRSNLSEVYFNAGLTKLGHVDTALSFTQRPCRNATKGGCVAT